MAKKKPQEKPTEPPGSTDDTRTTPTPDPETETVEDVVGELDLDDDEPDSAPVLIVIALNGVQYTNEEAKSMILNMLDRNSVNYLKVEVVPSQDDEPDEEDGDD